MILQNDPSLDAAHVAPKLWVGSFQAARDAHTSDLKFSLLALCAQELQPSLPFQGKIIRPAFEDNNPIHPDAVVRAIEAGNEIADHIKCGGRALVTCAAGLNRSALCAGFALKKIYPTWSSERVIGQIRKFRSPMALCNPYFCQLLQMYCD